MRTRLAAWWREVSWIANGILGANAYQNYLAHHSGTGCQHEPMSESEFWRAKYRYEDEHLSARCC